MKKINMERLIYTTFIILLLFQRVFTQYISFFSYIDEIIMIILAFTYLLRIIRRKSILKDEGIILGILALFVLSGILGNALSEYSRKLSLIENTIIFWIKSFIVFLSTYSYFRGNKDDAKIVVKNISRIMKVIVCIATIMLITSPVTHIGIETYSWRVRYGLHAFCFLYSKASIFSWYCIAYMLILTLDNAINKKRNTPYLIMTSICWVMTLRSRAFAYVVCYWILYILFYKVDKSKLAKVKKIKLRHIICILTIAILIAVPAIKKYFGNHDTSRYILLTTGIDIAINKFPLGYGFSTFGTTASYLEYSPVYVKYRFNNIYALNGENGGNELIDSYWPALLGETGIIGTALIVLLVSYIFKKAISKAKKNQITYMCVIFLLLTSMFSSLVTAVFSADIMILYFMILNLTCGINEEKKES